MDFAWLSVITKWAEEMGFGRMQTTIIVIGVGVLYYLGKILNGIKSGYGVILQDQKDATQVLRDQIQVERAEREKLFADLALAKQDQVELLSAMSKMRLILVNHGLIVPDDIKSTIDRVIGGPDENTAEGTG